MMAISRAQAASLEWQLAPVLHYQQWEPRPLKLKPTAPVTFQPI